MNDIWNIPRRQRPSFWWRLVRGLSALLVVVVEVLAATVLAQRGIAGPGLVTRADLLPGAATGAIGWSVLQSVGVSIVNQQLERANLLYGYSRW